MSLGLGSNWISRFQLKPLMPGCSRTFWAAAVLESDNKPTFFSLLLFKATQAGVKVRFARGFSTSEYYVFAAPAASAFQAQFWDSNCFCGTMKLQRGRFPDVLLWRRMSWLLLVFPLARWFKSQLSHRHHLQAAAAAAWHLWTAVLEEGRWRKDYEAHINGKNSDWINTHLTILTADSLSCSGWERTAEPAGLAVQTWPSSEVRLRGVKGKS